ncbi:DUF6204 family protein [Amycolatopsis sp. H20-H5]|uniref:DUF6204 family protein n=1 Tax=Amycolatopsis sp. H20-H5 TaxID=3046309 RepID=UPI002DBAC4BB|nr:DUF6204 family protein [Amycolatopsis sp. H20-H5]MEC3976560.1 DUF6204 family protein [Amycolatopsis sp. H20-H5]
MATYRVLVNGKFDHPDDATRARLLADAEPQGLAQLRFTEEGSLAYSPHLGSFGFRCTVRAEEERDAVDEAEFKAAGLLEAHGYPYRDLVSKVTCMDDIKIKRRSGSAK